MVDFLATICRVGTLILVLGIIFPTSRAMALTSRDASAVVGLIAALQPEYGQFAYDKEIAADWYERDAADKGLIAAAGFTAESWEVALGETVRGFLATIPIAELDPIFGRMKKAISDMEELSDTQKGETISAIDEQIDGLMILRAEGRPFVDIVRPLTPRIRGLILDPTIRQQ